MRLHTIRKYFAFGGLVALALAPAAQAQEWPSKPVRFVLAAAAGPANASPAGLEPAYLHGIAVRRARQFRSGGQCRPEPDDDCGEQ